MWIGKVPTFRLVGFAVLLVLFAGKARAAHLEPETVSAFDQYVRVTEARMDDDLQKGRFLYVDDLPAEKRARECANVRGGQLFVQSVHAKEKGQPISIPSGLLYDWVGIVFIPGAKLSQVMDVLEDYDHQQQIYKPDIRQSKLLERDGKDAKVYMQFYSKTIITVVINGNFDANYSVISPTRAIGESYSTRIAEVKNPDKPNERELPVGDDHGYLWRLRSYWRVEEADGGVYVQVESIGLSRSLPVLFAWLKPFLETIPEGYLSRVLKSTRVAVQMEMGETARVNP